MNWVSVNDEPIPTYKMHGKIFILNLNYRDYYGHTVSRNNQVVCAVWDSTNECFYEQSSGKEIDRRDITDWLKEDS